jgi:putative NADPH-quinone reductase
MQCLVVVAHPLRESFCHTVAAKATATLQAAGHDVAVEDLYGGGFAPALTADERASYYGRPYDAAAVQGEIDRLLATEGLVLCFPTWWFGFPAILKGWFDRTWAPGVAYDHADDLGAIKPRLHGLRRLLAITSLGSPWWVDRLVMGRPVRRTLKTALLGTCAPRCRFDMLSAYKAERLGDEDVRQFSAKVERTLAAWD